MPTHTSNPCRFLYLHNLSKPAPKPVKNPYPREGYGFLTGWIWVAPKIPGGYPSQSLGIFDMEILYCICSNAVNKDEQLMNAGLFPSSFKQIETAFTFAVLDDFLTDNLECKTTAQQYYSKLQSITNRMFPDSIPVSWHAFTKPSIIL